MFAPLPTGFVKLSEAVESLSKFALAAPPALEDLGLRMRKQYAKVRETGYQGLSRGAIRRLPYAMWIEGGPPLYEVEPELVRAYWGRHLPEALAQPRAAKRWLSPLFYVYCHWFRRGQADFQAFAKRLQMVVAIAQGPASHWMRDLQESYRWFDPDEVGLQLGRKLVTDLVPIQESLNRMNLWAGFLEERLASEAFSGALRLPNQELVLEPVIQRLMTWSRSELRSGQDHAGFRYPEHQAALADALVRPWLQSPPPEKIKNSLLAFLMKHYGDPRQLTSVHTGHRWHGVSPATVSAVKRWLVGDTLRGFMRILQLTADEIWSYRQKFWMAYYDVGVIDEAWVVLGSHAHAQAKGDFHGYGRLSSGAASDQSVLFLRIGGIQFMEWSHHGSLRASRIDAPDCPPMYLREYSGTDLRLVRSMDFHDGRTQQPQLTHMHSDRGTWQRRARDFIAKHTGVRLNDQAIIG